MKEKNKGGRPTKYTTELAQYICDIVATHPHGIQRLVKMYPKMPDVATITNWRHVYPEFFADYVQARQKQAHLLFECAIDEIEELEEYVYKNPDTGAREINAGIVAMKKAIANTKSRHAAILNKNYQLNNEDKDDSEKNELFSKIRGMLNEQNKINTSEI